MHNNKAGHCSLQILVSSCASLAGKMEKFKYEMLVNSIYNVMNSLNGQKADTISYEAKWWDLPEETDRPSSRRN